mgnify:CR=1 FL=1
MTNEAIDKLYQHPDLRRYAREIRNKVNAGKLPRLMLTRGQDGKMLKYLKRSRRHLTNQKINDKEITHHKMKVALMHQSLPTIRVMVEVFAYENGIELGEKKAGA